MPASVRVVDCVGGSAFAWSGWYFRLEVSQSDVLLMAERFALQRVGDDGAGEVRRAVKAFAPHAVFDLTEPYWCFYGKEYHTQRWLFFEPGANRAIFVYVSGG